METPTVYVTRERTNTLLCINYLLGRPPAVRNPTSMSYIAAIYDELVGIVCDEKLAVIDRLRETGYTAPICVCQLAGCCSKVKECKYCAHTMYWLQTINYDTQAWNKQELTLTASVISTDSNGSVKVNEIYKYNCRYGNRCTNNSCQYNHH